MRRILLTCVALLVLAAIPCHATIKYRVSVAQPDQHLVRVTMTVPSVGSELLVRMPAWNATYRIRDFAHRVQQVRARDAWQQPLAVRKMDKQTWSIAAPPKGGAASVEYATYWDEPGPFSAQLNAEHAFLNLAMVLMYIEERRAEDVEIEFTEVPDEWQVAVALKPAPKTAAIAFIAPNYDALVDAPVEIGKFSQFVVDTGGARIRVVVHGTGWQQAPLEDVVRKSASYQIAMMEDAPFEEFTFIYHFGLGGGGGMEHANSTAIHAGSATNVAGVSAHEFFHLWNVKRIRPKTLEPVDYSRENWTRALWFAEGVTNTYADFTLVRSGLWTRPQYYAALAGAISTLESRPARLWKSAEESSLDAWIESNAVYRRPDFSINYYNKGELLGVLLDILIRDATNNRGSLDDVMRNLNNEFARRGKFYDETRDLQAAVEKVANRSFEAFFKDYVAGTEPLPYHDILSRAGLYLKQGEAPGADAGFTASGGPGETIFVTSVVAGSAAARAGLREGDALLLLNDSTPPRDNNWARERKPGESVKLTIARSGRPREVSFVLEARPSSTFEVREEPNPSNKERRIREGMLIGKTDR